MHRARVILSPLLFINLFIRLDVISKNTNKIMTQYKLKRAYEPASDSDGFRVYIDRLWPRGLSHEKFPYDLWDKDIAPSTKLREWFHADPNNRWEEFKKRYTTELMDNPAFTALKHLLATKKIVTLLYSSHDQEHNNAVVVYDLLTSKS